MSGSRMGVDPSLAVAGARRTLRRLELEAYASVMTAFRAQGPLTCDKKRSLEQLGKLLGISSERHRAEVRRAVNDELLSAIASCVCLADSEEMWQREGQKLASTNPRFVARQLSHLPHLLTSTTVSNALSLQNARPDPELRKNTSTQVQNVLKFIISQNPLNSGAVTGAKQALGKITLQAGTGKPLAKSPSKLPPSNEGSPSGTANTQVQASSTTPPTSSTASSTAVASKTPVKEEKLSPGSKDGTLVSLPGKGGMSPTGQQPVPPTPEKATAGKQRKSVSGGKSSMLVGLLEGRKSVCEIESSSGAVSHVSQGEEKSSVSPESDATTTEERVDEVEAKVEEKGERMEEEEEKENEKRSDGSSISGLSGGEEMAKVEEEIQPQEKDASPDEEEKVEVKQEEEDKVKEEEKKEERESEKMDVQSSVVGESGERQAEGEEGCEPELVCEEIMPKTVPARDSSSDPAPPSSSDSLILPPPAEPVTVTQLLSSPTEDTTTLPPPPDPSDGVAPPLLPDGKSIGSQLAEKVEESEEMMKEEPSLTPAPPPTETQPESSPDAIASDEKECKVTSASASTVTASDDSGLVSESRKRPLPTDTPLPPSPKKTHLTSPPPNPPQPPPPLPPPPPSSAAKTSTTVPPSSLPIPPPTTSSITKPTVQPPPLVFSPLPTPSKAQVVDEGGRKKDNNGVSESIFRQVGPGGPVGRVGGVTIQPLLPSSSLSLPSVCLPLHSVSTITKPTSLPSLAPTTQPASVSVRPTPPVSAPPPLLSFPTLTPSPLPSLASSSITTHSSPLTLSTTPTPTPLPISTSLQLPNEATSSVQKSMAFQTTPTPTSESRIVSDVTMMSSTSDEALIRELCSEAAEDTTAAALASQLGLEFLEPNLLGGLDLMQLVNSPLEEVKPAITKNECPQRGGSVSTPGPSAEPAVLTEVDTTHLLSEALTSLSNPSTPLLPSSLPPFHPPLFPASSALVSTESPVQPLSRQLNDATTPSLPPSLITSHSSPFTPHTPQIFTPQTPSLSSPLTPEILPDIEDLASANEADLLEGIPPELAETIQALAQFESPLQ